MADKKPHMNLIFIGHVDHGKSTTVGRILYETGAISEAEKRKLEEEAAKVGKATFEFAFVMDQLKEERERGVTIDVSHKEFQTQKYYFTIIDAPGHRDFVKNMITGTSQADAAVIVCSVKDGPQSQTREHIFLAKTLGVKQVIIALNKMDTINYDEARFKEVKAELEKIMGGVGYKIAEIPFVPIASYLGENIKKKSDKMPWYTGKPLIEYFDDFKPTEKHAEKALRLSIQDAYSITGVGLVPVGKVETGTVNLNQKVIVMPSGAIGEIKSIEMHHQQMQSAEPGDNIGFNLKGIDKKLVTRGSVIGPVDNPPTVAEEFTAQIVVLNHPTAITVGYQPVIHAHTAQVACGITAILKQIDPKTGQVIKENPDFIKTGDVAIVVFKPSKPLCVEKASEFPGLGRIAVRDMGSTVAAGMIIDVKKRA